MGEGLWRSAASLERAWRGGGKQSSECIPLTFPFPLLLVAARRTQSIAISILKRIQQ
jgi:hypothetical protein